MTTVASPPPEVGADSQARRVGATSRRDRWWVQPIAIVAALSLFGVYTIIRAILSKHYAITADGAHLQSPFFSPDLPGLFSFKTGLPWAFLVLWAPLGLRTTCYYYRKSYYRSFFLAPPSCAVAGMSRKRYEGETKFPFVLNNLHRFFWYIAVVVVSWLSYDAIRAFFYSTPTGTKFGVSLGAIIMVANVGLIGAFTFGCNSFRHIIGGNLNCFSCSTSARTRHKAWQKVSILNHHHQLWAWVSMFSVLFTDLYIWLSSSGAFTDPHHIF